MQFDLYVPFFGFCFTISLKMLIFAHKRTQSMIINKIYRSISATLLMLVTLNVCAFQWDRGEHISISISYGEEPIVQKAVRLLQRDAMSVLHSELTPSYDDYKIFVATRPELFGKQAHEAFLLEATKDGRLCIYGSDGHGTAYGIIELTRLLGVTPWEWWADVQPQSKQRLELPVGYRNRQQPSVAFRGIFINDEDWGLLPWANEKEYGVKNTHEMNEAGKPVQHGKIGPKTNERIFELLLRLRANTYWPAMHDCTWPFFMTEGNRELAAQWGIYIGTSHCEPMGCNVFCEWPLRGQGDYDYVHNDSTVYRFWEDRVRDVAGQEMFYTLGMRGNHDDPLNGANTVDEQRAVIARAIADQRGMLQKYTSLDVPQVFIPYKEVLDVYNSGLQVPEDITLMWCDDNYGYIRHMPTKEERARKGGNGLYYHVSYWGRPHDYLWLGTFSPALLYQQMRQAYDYGIQKLWILNVGDIKPAEYQIQLFMDLAWNINIPSWKQHLHQFLADNVGDADRLTPLMIESYRLAYIHKPEFMAGTRTEEADKAWLEPHVLSFDSERMDQYQRLSDAVDNANPTDAYFQLVQYPVQGAMQMNRKFILGDLQAQDSIARLTQRYNTPKWDGIMDAEPRRQPVFCKQPLGPARINPARTGYLLPSLNNLEGLGYHETAFTLRKKHTWTLPDMEGDSIEVELNFIPTHPINGKSLRVRVNGQTIDYATQGRSEEWKENVLWNRATRVVRLPKVKKLTLEPLDEGIIIDEVYVYGKK